MRSSKHAEDLAKYTRGWTIVKVESSSRPECWWKLTLCKSGRQRTLHLFANDLGAHVEDVQEKGKHLKFNSMVSIMLDHVCDMQDKYDMEMMESVSFVAFDNPRTREVGFRCPLTGREFISDLTAVKESSYVKRLSTVQNRQKFAEDVWNMNGIW